MTALIISSILGFILGIITVLIVFGAGGGDS